MSWIAPTLWDLLGMGDRRRRRRPARPPGPDPGVPPRAITPMQRRYETLVEDMKRGHGIRVRKWRRDTTGVAWCVHYADGTVSRLIEAPYPRGPVSCAVFLHEIGHHAIGFKTYKPRCLEEYHAWRWALETMRREGLNVTPPVERRMTEALKYAVRKARRRGLKRLPVELVPYLAHPPDSAGSNP